MSRASSPWTPQRAIAEHERYTNWHGASDLIDEAVRRIVTECRAPLLDICQRLTADLGKAFDSGDPQRILAVRPQNLGALATAMRAALRDVAVGGAESTRQELARQSLGQPLYDHQGLIASPGASLALPWLDDIMLADGERSILAQIRARVETILRAIVANVVAIGRRLVLDMLRRKRRYDHDLVTEALIYAAGTQARQEAMGAAPEAFAIGRTDVLARAHAEGRLREVVYSAILDRNTCGPCGASDGTRTTFGSPTYVALDPPNLACQSRLSGRNMCRCQWVGVLA